MMLKLSSHTENLLCHATVVLLDTLEVHIDVCTQYCLVQEVEIMPVHILLIIIYHNHS